MRRALSGKIPDGVWFRWGPRDDVMPASSRTTSAAPNELLGICDHTLPVETPLNTLAPPDQSPRRLVVTGRSILLTSDNTHTVDTQ